MASAATIIVSDPIAARREVAGQLGATHSIDPTSEDLAARVLEILALEPQAPDALFAALPASPSSPEYRLVLEEGQSAELMRALDAHKVFDDARLVELDGLRVEFADGALRGVNIAAMIRRGYA